MNDENANTPDPVSRLSPLTESTPLRKLRDGNSAKIFDNQPSPPRDVVSENSSIADGMQNSQENVAVGALKASVLNSSFGDNKLLQWASRHSPGTVATRLLLIAAAAGFTAVAIGVFGIQSSSVLAIIGTSIFGIVSLASISCLLFFNQDTSIRSFKVPFVPFLPFLSAIINIILILSLQPTTWLRFVIWLSIGLIIYCVYGYKNSCEGKAASE